MKRLIYKPADSEDIPEGAMFVGAYVDALVSDDFTTKGTIVYGAIHRGNWLEVLQGKDFVMQHSWAGWDLPTTPPKQEKEPNVQ